MLTLPPLYAILDVESVTARGWAPVDVCRAWLSAGVQLIQLRGKALASGAFLELADEVTELCRQAGALLIINDRADVAAMSGADGVHVGQDDLPPADARRVAGPSAIIGLSTHDEAQVERGGREPVSYLAIGPVYSTVTKETGYAALGPEGVRAAAVLAKAAGLPLVAIGGISLERAGEVRAAGADSLAVISGLLPEARTGIEKLARTWLQASRARL